MNKLSLAVAASLLALTAAACKQQPATQNDTTAAAPAQAPNGDWSQLVTQTGEGGMLVGNPQAKVKLVEFASMTCSHCADFARDGEPKLVEQYVKTGNVSFEFRNYVRDPLDITASLITRCVGATPQFFSLTNALFADQKSMFDKLQAVPEAQLTALQSLPPAQQFQRMAQYAGLQEWAAQRGVPSAKTGQCLANQAEIDKLVQMNSDTTSTYTDFQGTPGFVINGEFLGSPRWPELEGKIKEAL